MAKQHKPTIIRAFVFWDLFVLFFNGPRVVKLIPCNHAVWAC
ncbi:unnamed protein product [Brassica napus]|uniref:(rape) hypothetical protein n=1 Tax=Brassica napus TaxID=3708 RepID=A0A816WUM6_BRANA|nr:unnamed protein product [Brassica napus]